MATDSSSIGGLCHLIGAPSYDKGIWIPSNETVGQFIDIANGEVADNAVVGKATGESVCFILPWRGQLRVGKYVLKVEIGSSNSPRLSKWFLLENRGTATDPNSLAASIGLKELKEKEIVKYTLLRNQPPKSFPRIVFANIFANKLFRTANH